MKGFKMPLKRKSKSEMIKVIPLPEFKSNRDVVRCSKCRKLHNKTDMNRMKRIVAYYYCDECKKKYIGKNEFVEKGV